MRLGTIQNLAPNLLAGRQNNLMDYRILTGTYTLASLVEGFREVTLKLQRLCDGVAGANSTAVRSRFSVCRLKECGMERVVVEEPPLEIESGPGNAFLYHPLLRGGFLDDAYECFTDQGLAEEVMSTVAKDLENFLPLVALRCVMSGWKTAS